MAAPAESPEMVTGWRTARPFKAREVAMSLDHIPANASLPRDNTSVEDATYPRPKVVTLSEMVHLALEAAEHLANKLGRTSVMKAGDWDKLPELLGKPADDDGIDDAIGVPPSKLGWIVACGGVTGALAAVRRSLDVLGRLLAEVGA